MAAELAVAAAVTVAKSAPLVVAAEAMVVGVAPGLRCPLC